MVDNRRTFTAPQSLLETNLTFPNDEPSLTTITVTRERCVDPSLIDSFLSAIIIKKTTAEPLIDARIDPYAARERAEKQEAQYKDWTKVTEWVANNRKNRTNFNFYNRGHFKAKLRAK
ncbi:AIE_G0000960.mRNA.1.CDS.1 [Saccharomyces cerevisiae]|nr:AIE_G0000960.mRNA.1.CDS.1 [Saccharomyces cerevisiae]CAI6474368.1 AIE_G0000960.mRNA.1.CDS.1 [Saccharomyces cerevisiae]